MKRTSHKIKVESSLFCFDDRGGEVLEERLYIRIPDEIVASMELTEETILQVEVTEGTMKARKDN